MLLHRNCHLFARIATNHVFNQTKRITNKFLVPYFVTLQHNVTFKYMNNSVLKTIFYNTNNLFSAVKRKKKK